MLACSLPLGARPLPLVARPLLLVARFPPPATLRRRSAFAMQVICRKMSGAASIKTVLHDVPLDRGGNESGNRFASGQSLANVGGRHVGRWRVHEKNGRKRGVALNKVAAGDWRLAAGLHAQTGHSRRETRQPIAQWLHQATRARDNNAMRAVEHLGIAIPRFNFCKRAGARDEEN